MRKPVRRTLFVAALVAGAAMPSLGNVAVTGNVVGRVEFPLICAIRACRELEDLPYALASQAPDQEKPLPEPTAVTARALVTGALACLADAKTSIFIGSGYEASTDAERALAWLVKAEERDREALDGIDGKKPASKVALSLYFADLYKEFAENSLKGTPADRKDLTALNNNPDTPTSFIFEPDLRSPRIIIKLTPADQEAGTGDSYEARVKAIIERVVSQYGYARLSTSAAKAAKAPRNYYFAYEGTSADPGYIFKSLGRRMFGPFETRFQVGAFDPKATVDTGSACVEFDVEGSSPLQFFAVCGRRVNGGVQVFAQSHLGAAGSLFIPNTRIAQVRVNYSGTQFTCSAAAGKDAPDFALTPFATYGLTQGSTALVPGIGASGLTKGAVIGLDEIYFTAK